MYLNGRRGRETLVEYFKVKFQNLRRRWLTTTNRVRISSFSIESVLIGLSVLIIRQWEAARRLCYNLRRDREIPNTKKPTGHELRTDNTYGIPRSMQRYSRPWIAANFRSFPNARFVSHDVMSVTNSYGLVPT